MEDLTAEQIQFLTYTVLGEARGEGPEGMLGVANVIANRVDSPLYPDNPVDVAAQTYQFSTNNRGAGGNQTTTRREVPVGSDLYNQAEEIVRGAIVERNLPDITGRALMYHARGITPYWADEATTRWGTTRVGNHVFYARQPVPPNNIPDVATLLSVRRAPPVPLSRTPTVKAKQAQAMASQRVADAAAAVDNQRRKAAVAFFPWSLANEGDRGQAAMSMTSRLGSRPDFSDSIAAPGIGGYSRAREDAFAVGWGALLGRRVSLTAPNPVRAEDVSRQVFGGLVESGNIDMSKRPTVRNKDGSVSTVRTISFEQNGVEILVPTVTSSGRIMSDEQAIRQYERTGQHLGKFTDPVSATRYAQELHRREEIRVTARPQGPQGRSSAKPRETLRAGDTRTAESGLITYVRKTVPIDDYGHPILEAPTVVRPTAKPSPTLRVQNAITRSKAAVSSAAMAPIAAATAAWNRPTASATVTGSSGVSRSAAISVSPSRVTLSGGGTGSSAAMRAAAATVSATAMKRQPAGSTTTKSGTQRLPSGQLPVVDPTVKDNAFRYVAPTKVPTPAPIPVKPVAPTPLPRLRRFGDPIIPPSVKGDPIDIRKLVAGVEAEGRRLSGAPAPIAPVAPVLPGRRPDTSRVSPTVPARRPDTPAAVAPGKVKLSGVPDKAPPPLPAARPVSTGTVKAPGKVSPVVPGRRPDTQPMARKPVVIEVVGGRRTASPRLVPPQLPNAGGVQSFNPTVNGLTQSSSWQESTFGWTENTYLPDAVANNPNFNPSPQPSSPSRWW